MTGDSFVAVQAAVVAWHEARFPDALREHVALKGAEEMGEVASAILGDLGRRSATGRGDVPAEMADVLVVLMVLAGRWYRDVDLLAEVTKKVAILTDPNSGHRASLATPAPNGAIGASS